MNPVGHSEITYEVPFGIPHKLFNPYIKYVWIVEKWRFKSSKIYELKSVFEMPPRDT